MKTSTSTKKNKKVSEPRELAKSRKVSSNRIEPSEEEIREKAAEIYYQRIERGEYRSAIEDWLEAEAYFRE